MGLRRPPLKLPLECSAARQKLAAPLAGLDECGGQHGQENRLWRAASWNPDLRSAARFRWSRIAVRPQQASTKPSLRALLPEGADRASSHENHRRRVPASSARRRLIRSWFLASSECSAGTKENDSCGEVWLPTCAAKDS